MVSDLNELSCYLTRLTRYPVDKLAAALPLARGANEAFAKATATTAGASVVISDVSKIFYDRKRDVVALEGIDFEVPSGKFVTILGPSGCGKSTLLSLIAGLLPVTTGRIAVNGERVRGPLRNVGMVLQEDALLEWRSVIGNVLLPIEIKHLHRRSGEERARQLLLQVGLEGFEHARPSQLSGGMKQRVALCQAVVHEPALLLMDEPFGALDALTREQMQYDLQQLRTLITNTVVFVTHSIAEAVLLSDRIIVMSPRPGRIVKEYPVDLPRPRDDDSKRSPQYLELSSEIYAVFREQGVLRK